MKQPKNSIRIESRRRRFAALFLQVWHLLNTNALVRGTP